MSNLIRFPTERTPNGKIQAAWDNYQRELTAWRLEHGLPAQPPADEFVYEEEEVLK